MKRLQITILVLLVSLVCGGLAAVSADAVKPQNALREKALRKQLRKLNLNAVHTFCIPDERGGGQIFSYRCNWLARGQWTGSIPYRCHGKAGYVAETRRWTIDPCVNKIGPRIPLAAKPQARPLFGFNEDWAIHLGKLDDLGRIGGAVGRQNLAWAAIERNRGTYDWSHFDKVNSRMERQGIRPLWILIGSPCWAQAKPAQCEAGDDQIRPEPDHYDEFADFAAAAAARYPDAAGLEVWNEPNYSPFWGGPPDPDAYSRMLTVVASRLIDSPVPVISGGLSPHGAGKSTSHAMDQAMFVRAMFRNGAAQLVDGIGTHSYPSTSKPDRIVDQMRAQLGNVREAMADFGAADKPLWVTEAGVSTAGPAKLNGKQQARALADIYKTLRRVRQVPVVVFHRFIDGPRAAGPREPGMGVLDSKGKRKPAFCAVARALGKHCG